MSPRPTPFVMPWTYWKCTGSLLFSWVSWTCALISISRVRGSDQSSWPISGRTGKSHSGGFCSAWCQTKTIPFFSWTSQARTLARFGIFSQ